jgi:hypothetical protein
VTEKREALAAIGGGWATLGAAADARAYPSPGQLIDVGGHRLHLSCTRSGSRRGRAGPVTRPAVDLDQISTLNLGAPSDGTPILVLSGRAGCPRAEE